MPQQFRTCQGREHEYGYDHYGSQRQAQQQKARNDAEPIGTRDTRSEFQARDVDAQFAKIACHQAAAGVDGAFVEARRRNEVRYQQQCGEAARRKAGLAAQDKSYIAGCGDETWGSEATPAWISIAQGVSGGSFRNAFMK